MIIGTGIDVIELERIRRAMENPRFADRILTPIERAGGTSTAYMAGRWAAKEAIYKASPISLTWQQIEIESLPSGAPRVRVLHPGWDNSIRIWISISHERSVAAAVVILET